VRAALTTFLALPVLQRSTVLLKDVLDLSLDEIAQTTGTTLPAAKAALHRGRVSSTPATGTVCRRSYPEECRLDQDEV
jgi:DNA-directed RNA polymerase specialized sigma24 family protein